MHYKILPDWHTLPELSRLKDLPNPPKTLLYQGRWNPDMFTSCVAVVGARRMTDYGRRIVEKIIPRLVFEKKTIISGFMYGVDQYAHAVCIENEGKTIAVLGWGINRDMEDRDKRLAENIIASGGLIISEWKDQKPTLWTFPLRNRIVAALAHDVIVVEAAVKSGSLITANIARKLKRRLWVAFGPTVGNVSAGNRMLLDEGYAKPWLV